MSASSGKPRLAALALMVGGALAGSLMIAAGGMETGGRAGNKMIAVIGFAGIAFGIGFVQLIWPPPPKTGPDDQRNFFSRSPWPQKVFYIAGGLVGVVAAAVLMTWAGGEI